MSIILAPFLLFLSFKSVLFPFFLLLSVIINQYLAVLFVDNRAQLVCVSDKCAIHMASFDILLTTLVWLSIVVSDVLIYQSGR